MSDVVEWIKGIAALASLVGVVAALLKAGDAKVEAKAAADRAEQALAEVSRIANALQSQQLTQADRARAELDATGIAEQWRGKIKQAFAQQGRPGFGFNVREPAPSLAHRLAIDIVRTEREALHLMEVRYDERDGGIAIFAGLGIGTIRQQKRR